MTLQNQQFFITGKIQELQTAILHFHTDSVLKLPTSVAQTLHVDEAGCLWMTVSKPAQVINEFDKSFHVALNYYRKGKPFFVNTYGVARLVTDPEETSQLPAQLKEEYAKGKLILCVRMKEVNYYEKENNYEQSFLQKCKQRITGLFADNSNYYHVDFDEQKYYA